MVRKTNRHSFMAVVISLLATKDLLYCNFKMEYLVYGGMVIVYISFIDSCLSQRIFYSYLRTGILIKYRYLY